MKRYLVKRRSRRQRWRFTHADRKIMEGLKQALAYARGEYVEGLSFSGRNAEANRLEHESRRRPPGGSVS